jgi:site-specific recombinase XerD
MINKRSEKMVANQAKSSEATNNLQDRNKSKPKKKISTVQEYIDASQASSTKRAYASDLRHFLAHGGSVPCTPKRLAKYLVESANEGLAVATLERRITAIHKAHVEQKRQSPARSEIVRLVMQGIRRTLGTKQRQVMPLMKVDLLAALTAMEHHQMPIKTARDRALLLLGFASAMRRSELVQIRMEHLSHSENGVEIEIPISKTDQQRHGRTVFIPRATGEYCPVTALLRWLTVAGINEGYVLRAVNRHDRIANQCMSAQSVALIVKAAVAMIGGDAKNISGHSLRAGYCTSAAEAGLQLWQIREQTGHKSNVTLLKYIRQRNQKTVPSLL